MLKQRILTAMVLLAVLLPALFYSESWPFCTLALVFIAAAGWEWARINDWSNRTAMLTAGVCCFFCGLMWWNGWLSRSMPQLWLLAGGIWVLGGAFVLRAGVGAWSGHSRYARLLVGVIALCLTWLAVAQAKLIGTNYLLSILTLVWTADVGAYFAGRALGGRWSRTKLAVSISPGKSWEGVWGGMVGVIVLACVWRYVDLSTGATVPSLYTHIGQKSIGLLLLAAIFMAAMSVVGDLIESLVKRSAGVKDSSGLLPGHGGVLDRVDALLPALPLAMMLYSF